MSLPLDMSRCVNSKCQLKEDCLRYTESFIGRVYSEFKPVNMKCEFKIDKTK